jgi:RNA polymerase primary sigma factor
MVWYLQSIGPQPRLSAADELALAERIAAGSQEAKHKLVIANMPLVVSVAKRYIGQGVGLLDLIQEGSIGLLTAATQFDPAKGYRFSTYATWWIIQLIQRCISEHGRSIRMPVNLSANYYRLTRVSQQLEQELGRQPTLEELALRLGLSLGKVEHLNNGMSQGRARETLSLDYPVDEEQTVGDLLEDETCTTAEEIVDHHLLKDHLQQLLKRLTAVERFVIARRYELIDHPDYKVTASAIAQELHCTPARVRQIQCVALQKLRTMGEASHLHKFLD